MGEVTKDVNDLKGTPQNEIILIMLMKLTVEFTYLIWLILNIQDSKGNKGERENNLDLKFLKLFSLKMKYLVLYLVGTLCAFCSFFSVDLKLL